MHGEPHTMPGSREPLARRSDADAAHRGADRAEASGIVTSRLRHAFEAVHTWPGRTSAELGALSTPPAGTDHGRWRHDVARALPHLWKRGAIERVEQPDRDLTWWPLGQAPASAPPYIKPAARSRSEWDHAVARARARFRAARRRPSPEDIQGAAGIERRLARVYRGELVARLEPDGRVRTFEPPAEPRT